MEAVNRAIEQVKPERVGEVGVYEIKTLDRLAVESVRVEKKQGNPLLAD